MSFSFKLFGVDSFNFTDLRTLSLLSHLVELSFYLSHLSRPRVINLRSQLLKGRFGGEGKEIEDPLFGATGDDHRGTGVILSLFRCECPSLHGDNKKVITYICVVVPVSHYHGTR